MIPFMKNKDPRWNPDNSDYDRAVAVVRETGKASVGHLQTQLKIGNGKARRYLDKMEYHGIVKRNHLDRRIVVEVSDA